MFPEVIEYHIKCNTYGFGKYANTKSPGQSVQKQ